MVFFFFAGAQVDEYDPLHDVFGLAAELAATALRFFFTGLAAIFAERVACFFASADRDFFTFVTLAFRETDFLEADFCFTFLPEADAFFVTTGSGSAVGVLEASVAGGVTAEPASKALPVNA